MNLSDLVNALVLKPHLTLDHTGGPGSETRNDDVAAAFVPKCEYFSCGDLGLECDAYMTFIKLVRSVKFTDYCYSIRLEHGRRVPAMKSNTAWR